MGRVGRCAFVSPCDPSGPTTSRSSRDSRPPARSTARVHSVPVQGAGLHLVDGDHQALVRSLDQVLGLVRDLRPVGNKQRIQLAVNLPSIGPRPPITTSRQYKCTQYQQSWLRPPPSLFFSGCIPNKEMLPLSTSSSGLYHDAKTQSCQQRPPQPFPYPTKTVSLRSPCMPS
jgi:hypothetical protein